MEKTRNAYMVLVGKARKKEPLGIPRRRWADNIRRDFGEKVWGGIHWVGVAQDRDR
jgi:hypothetical protein